MKINFDNEKPIFIQLAEEIESAILIGAYEEETQIPSITEVSVSLQINPATALKGINILVEQGLVYKKRGIGMFIQKGAKKKIMEKRKESFFDMYIRNLLEEAQALEISKEEIIEMIKGR